jgi:hypothetical protein
MLGRVIVLESRALDFIVDPLCACVQQMDTKTY